MAAAYLNKIQEVGHLYCTVMVTTLSRMSLSDAIVRSSLALYTSLNFRPANPLQYTILSTFTLVRTEEGDDPDIKLISLATGLKCLPASRLSLVGDAVHDSHAEILARRGLVRWFLSELRTLPASEWIEQKAGGKWRLRRNVSVHMYTSALPCERLRPIA